jgi:8-oxo-dGTP pyrophosphatase MutT (NUDIX family)
MVAVPGSDDLVRINAVILVDRSGRILVQLRDDDAPNWPGRWGLPGGHADPGESDADAAVRELLEETALRADAGLTLFERLELPDLGIAKTYFYGTTGASQQDVVIGEGADMLFLRADEIFDGRVYTPTTLDTLRRFMSSEVYDRIMATTPRANSA